ncbi:MAG: hypothetical protein SGBAC_007836 [Bacillariaceae sp.]
MSYPSEKVDPTMTVPVGGPMEDSAEEYHPPAKLNCLSISSIILCIAGIGFGAAAGSAATASHDELSSTHQELETMNAQLFGFLGIAAFATAIPLLACSARGYQNIRGSKGLPVCMIIAWIAYGLGMVDALILLARSLVGGDVEPAWVYLAILYNFIPYLIMMSHAEVSRIR